MNDEEFDQFVQESIAELEKKQKSLTKTYRLGKWAAYSFDAPTGQLQFKDKSGTVQVRADTWPLGSFSAKSNTWQWAWANESTPVAVRKRAEKLKELYKLTRMDVFKMPTIEIDEAMAWELVAMCVRHLDAKGSYALPDSSVGKLIIFVAIGDIGKAME